MVETFTVYPSSPVLNAVIIPAKFEVTMLGVKPAIQYLGDFNTAFTEVKFSYHYPYNTTV
jgi:hypothetical protein